jgi:hypothetical protein
MKYVVEMDSGSMIYMHIKDAPYKNNVLLNGTRNSRYTVITDLDTSKWSTQKAFSCCDAILETGPAVSMRSELLVAHEKLGQFSLLAVYTVPV